MNTLDWRHIRNTVVITVLVWPFVAYFFVAVPALVVGTVLMMTNLSPDHFQSDRFFALYIFVLTVGITAFTSGKLFAPRRGVLHGLWSASIALPTAGLLTFAVLFALFPPPPADWQLIRRFERNEATFNGLRDAVRGAGGLESISALDVEPTDFEAVDVSRKRLETYHTDLKRLRLSRVSDRGETESVYLLADFRGSEISKGYVYRPASLDLGQLVEKIVADEVQGSTTFYRPIRDGWYLYAKAVSD